MGRKSKVEERKKEILHCYWQIVESEGFESTSIARIAEEMKIHPSLIIHYFKTKDDLVSELLITFIREYFDALKEKYYCESDVHRQFEVLVDGVFDVVSFPWNFKTMMNLVHYLAGRHEEILSNMKPVVTEFLEVLVVEMGKFMDCGILRRDDPRSVAELYQIVCEGLGKLGVHSPERFNDPNFRVFVVKKIRIMLGYIEKKEESE